VAARIPAQIVAQPEPECEPKPEPPSSYTYLIEEGAHPPNTSTPTRKPATRTQKGDPAAVPIPAELDTPEFRSLWADWLAERTARRKPLTERAARFQLADLAPLGPAAAAACIKASVANGWQGLFTDRFRDPARPSGAVAPTGPRIKRASDNPIFDWQPEPEPAGGGA
jgi:hypothetical protein